LFTYRHESLSSLCLGESGSGPGYGRRAGRRDRAWEGVLRPSRASRAASADDRAGDHGRFRRAGGCRVRAQRRSNLLPVGFTESVRGPTRTLRTWSTSPWPRSSLFLVAVRGDEWRRCGRALRWW